LPIQFHGKWLQFCSHIDDSSDLEKQSESNLIISDLQPFGRSPFQWSANWLSAGLPYLEFLRQIGMTIRLKAVKASQKLQ
jgi:hypothetical protein